MIDPRDVIIVVLVLGYLLLLSYTAVIKGERDHLKSQSRKDIQDLIDSL